MTRKNFNPGPDHGQFDFSTTETNPELVQPIEPTEQTQPTLSQEEYDKSVGKIYINEIRRMLNEGIPQEEVLEVINERIKALGAKPVEETVEVKSNEETKESKEDKESESEIDPVVEYDRKFQELYNEIFDKIERKHPAPEYARNEAERLARAQLGARPAEKKIENSTELLEISLEDKWLGYFKTQTLLNMVNAVGKLNSAAGRVAQGIVHIDNPSLTMKKRGADIYRPIEAQVKYLVSRGVLSGNVKDLSIAMFNDFIKDLGGRQYGGAIYHPRNNSLKETMDSLSGRIYKFKESLKNTKDPVDIASIKDVIKTLTAKKKDVLSTIVKNMNTNEKIEHESYKNRIKLKKSLEK